MSTHTDTEVERTVFVFVIIGLSGDVDQFTLIIKIHIICFNTQIFLDFHRFNTIPRGFLAKRSKYS